MILFRCNEPTMLLQSSRESAGLVGLGGLALAVVVGQGLWDPAGGGGGGGGADAAGTGVVLALLLLVLGPGNELGGGVRGGRGAKRLPLVSASPVTVSLRAASAARVAL